MNRLYEVYPVAKWTRKVELYLGDRRMEVDAGRYEVLVIFDDTDRMTEIQCIST